MIGAMSPDSGFDPNDRTLRGPAIADASWLGPVTLGGFLRHVAERA